MKSKIKPKIAIYLIYELGIEEKRRSNGMDIDKNRKCLYKKCECATDILSETAGAALIISTAPIIIIIMSKESDTLSIL